MIGYLNGIVKWQNENKVIINVNGVGYLVETPGQKIYNPGDEIELFIYTYVREDSLTLYGFQLNEERQLFATLLSVSGIGPRASLNILSSIPYQKFINAILTENIAVLKEVSGIGPKTAQRLILELKNKVKDFAVEVNTEDNRFINKMDEELNEALTSLGYTVSEINNALNQVDLIDSDSIEDKIRKVLSYLGKGS